MTISAFLRFLALALPVLLASCAKPAYQARGYASYVAEQYAGRYTSSGAIYQPQGWTAAHNTLPFGTVVKVKNNANGRTVNVTVTDRFPYYPNRIINLSRAAAEDLQIPYHRLGDVTVTAKTVAASAAPATNYNRPPTHYAKPASATHKAKVPAYHAPAAAGQGYYKSTVPPPGYGTAPPAGIPPPPPGYPGLR